MVIDIKLWYVDFRDLLLQTYAADIFFAQTWKDNRLRLPENMTSEYRYVELSWFNLKNIVFFVENSN